MTSPKINLNLLNHHKDNTYLQEILFNNFKWEFALKVSNIGIWDFDATTNSVNFSEESANILGFDADELNKHAESWNDLVHPDDKEKYFSDFKDHLHGKVSLYENLSRIKHKNGQYRWILDKGKIIERTENGEAKRVIGVHVDITDSKRKEKQLSESLNLITEQNKKLKNFAHIATHNLKEHSGNIESLIELYHQAESDDERAELMSGLKTVSDTLKKTIGNLREIVTVDSIRISDIEPIALKDFVYDSIESLLLGFSNTNARIQNQIDATLILNFNKPYLESIIQNLLTNALKYVHPERYPHIKIYTSETQYSVILTVEDNGIGIDLNAYGDDIFGLYRTFHNNEDAEGVGLYITKSQMESLGGRITVESEVGIGSKFILEFPKRLKT